MKLSPLKILLILLLLLSTDSIRSSSWRDHLIKPDKVMKKIGLRKGMKVGIVGAGKGYFSFKMAREVGETGRIYANEINKSHLAYIRKKCNKEGISNIVTVLGALKDPLFPDNRLDIVFMCYVFHDLEKPTPFLLNIKKYLSPEGRLVILDQIRDKTGNTHFYSKKRILKELKRGGFSVMKTETFLKRENIYICRPKLN